MSATPRFILRNCTIFVDRVNKIGQATEIVIPKLVRKTEDLMNAGMHFPIETPYGYEKPEMSWKMTGWDPQVLKLNGLAVGVTKEFMATGAFVDEDGTTHSGVCYSVGFLKEADPETWKPNEKNEPGYMISPRTWKFTMDGEEIYDVTPFDVKVGGVSQTAAINQALLSA